MKKIVSIDVRGHSSPDNCLCAENYTAGDSIHSKPGREIYNVHGPMGWDKQITLLV